jgi:hypothetical protein
MKTSKDNFHFSRSLSEIPAFTTEYRARGASQLVTRFMSFDEARRQVSIAQVFYLQSSLGYLAKKSLSRGTLQKSRVQWASHQMSGLRGALFNWDVGRHIS